MEADEVMSLWQSDAPNLFRLDATTILMFEDILRYTGQDGRFALNKTG